ncbi:MAG: vanadium-dependent haloperoxidase [Actinomycetota bacterium]
MNDPILYWNDVALEANRVSHTAAIKEQAGPVLSARALAIVHIAMYDAFAGVAGNPAGLPFYLPGLPAPAPGASPDAAVARAAHATLTALFPSQTIYFNSKYFEAGLAGPGIAEGEAFGQSCAQAILADRAADPDAGQVGYIPSTDRGRHRLDPFNPGQPYHAPFYGDQSKGFAITDAWKLDDPPAADLNDPAYLRALREVRAKGIANHLMGTVASADRRIVDEEVIGLYWGYDGAFGLGTPPRLYNQVIRVVAEAKLNTVGENARLFALVNVAMADAGILAWRDKYRIDLWRPVLGIRELDPSMGPSGQPKSNINNNTHVSWEPLGAPKTNEPGVRNFTPPFPAYPSGHATFGAAAFHMTRLFYGPAGVNKGGVPVGHRAPDTLFQNLSFVSEELNGINTDNAGVVRPKHVRSFPKGLWQMIEENGRSRVYLGVHWVFDAFAVKPNGQMDLTMNIGGVPLGITIAEDIFSTGMAKSPVLPSV